MDEQIRTAIQGPGAAIARVIDALVGNDFRVCVSRNWMTELEAEPDFESVLQRGSGVFDGRGVDRFCVLGDGCPVRRGDFMVVMDRDVTVGDAGEGGCDAEVVDEPLPPVVVAGGVVEVAFESVGLVAPDGPAGGPRGNGSEDIEVELGGMVGKS